MWTKQNVVFIDDSDVFRSTGKFFTAGGAKNNLWCYVTFY